MAGTAVIVGALGTVAPTGGSSRFVITSQACSILNIFLEAPERPRYGLELMKATGLSSGTVYPVIYRFERAGWLTATPEPIDPQKAGRRRRRAFKITPEGIQGAQMAKAELRHEAARRADEKRQRRGSAIPPIPGYTAGATG
ncbi:PadR family transcriptional regulator [Streptomyces sp. NPDC002078]